MAWGRIIHGSGSHVCTFALDVLQGKVTAHCNFWVVSFEWTWLSRSHRTIPEVWLPVPGYIYSLGLPLHHCYYICTRQQHYWWHLLVKEIHLGISQVQRIGILYLGGFHSSSDSSEALQTSVFYSVAVQLCFFPLLWYLYLRPSRVNIYKHMMGLTMIHPIKVKVAT